MNLYGLCSPTQNGEKTFDYGIGVILNEDTGVMDEETMVKMGYKIWNVVPETYAVFKCIGENGAFYVSMRLNYNIEMELLITGYYKY